MTRASLAWVVALGGCAYQSQYRAPGDGRPRAVWKSDHVVMDRAGAPLEYACMQSLAGVSGSHELRLVEGDLRVDPIALPRRGAAVTVVVAGAFFVPHYWGAPL